MIKSFKHKGLENYFERGTKKGILPEHATKIGRILDRLEASIKVEDMNLPGFRLHQLSGKEKGLWSVVVNGNWRIIFYFEEGDAYVVDYRDYH